MHLFDVIGPVMIGPSSSHTAGAARIGRVARGLLGEAPVRARIGFHGSFAKTYAGHGTDRAVLGGLLGMDVDDVRLRESFFHAGEAGLAYEFEVLGLRDAHPNTLVLELEGRSGARVKVRAASLGGGSILVQEIDGLAVSLSGQVPTLVIMHRDMAGMIASITGLVAQEGINIASMNVARQSAGRMAIMVLELDSRPSEGAVAALGALVDVHRVTFLKKAEKGMETC